MIQGRYVTVINMQYNSSLLQRAKSKAGLAFVREAQILHDLRFSEKAWVVVHIMA